MSPSMPEIRLDRVQLSFNPQTQKLELPATHPELDYDRVCLWEMRLPDNASSTPKSQRAFSRNLLLQVLALYFDGKVENVRLIILASGKPEIFPGSNPNQIQFSVSHCQDRMIVAIGKGRALGVDIEVIRSQTKSLAIAQQYFSEREATHLGSLSQEKCNRDFIRIWTCKEAVVKALGTGMFQHMRTIEIDIKGDAKINALVSLPDLTMQLTSAPLSKWNICELDVANYGQRSHHTAERLIASEPLIAAEQIWFGALAVAPSI